MKVKKTIWIPIVGGLTLGLLSFLTTAASFTVQISEDLILGPWEVFNVISAALFGPIGLLITEIGLDASGYVYIIKGIYPAPQDVLFLVGNYIAHIIPLMLVAFGYKNIHKRLRMPGFLAGWLLVMVIYYLGTIMLSVPMHNLAVPGLSATYAVYFSDNVRLEFVLVTVITSLILLALPERFRKPQWYAPKQIPDRSSALLDEKEAGPR